VAHFRVYQGKPDDKLPPSRWEKTMTLLPGRNELTLLIRHGIGSMDSMKGDVSSFTIGMFQPEKGQTVLVPNVRLSPDWPAPTPLPELCADAGLLFLPVGAAVCGFGSRSSNLLLGRLIFVYPPGPVDHS
jgi:hypothetical protein